MASASKQSRKSRKSRKSKKVIEIRGHHLDFLHYWIGEIDKGACKKDYIRTLRRKYGEKFAVKTWGIINMLCDNEVEVEIVGGLDEICSVGCKRKHKGCIGDDKYPANLDMEAAIYYELILGEVYSSRKVIGSIRKKEKSHCGYISS